MDTLTKTKNFAEGYPVILAIDLIIFKPQYYEKGCRYSDHL